MNSYSAREVQLIDSIVVPMILGDRCLVGARPDRLHVGYEQMAFFCSVLRNLRPRAAIEVGTFEGQTFALIAKYAERAISIDPDDGVRRLLQPLFSNAEFYVGTSDNVLPGLIDEFNSSEWPLEFAFIDGNHSAEFVRRDINNLLRYRPKTQTVILMHDTFNPECRSGVLGADWARCEFCHFFEVDAVPGLVHPAMNCRGEMWGGVGMALLLPEPRKESLVVRQTHQLTFEAARNSRNR